jgi:cellulase/cellobiase CelA1
MPLIPLYEEIPGKSSKTASTSSPLLMQPGPDQHLQIKVISNSSQDNE